MPSSELKVSQSWATRSTSSYLVSTQKPPCWSLCATGQSDRARASVGWSSRANTGDRWSKWRVTQSSVICSIGAPCRDVGRLVCASKQVEHLRGVLAEAWDGRAGARGRRGSGAGREARLLSQSPVAPLIADHTAELPVDRVVEEAGREAFPVGLGDQFGRDAGGAQFRYPVSRGPGSEGGLEEELFGLGVATDRSERWGGRGQGGQAWYGAQPAPCQLVWDGEGEPGAVGALVDAVGGAVAGLPAVEDRAAHGAVRGQERAGLEGERGAEQARRDGLAAAGAAAGVQAGEDPAGGQPAAGDVDRAPYEVGRRLAGAALPGLHPGQGLHELVVGGQQGAGAMLAEAAGEAVDGAGIGLADGGLVVAELLGQADPGVVVHHVAAPEQLAEHGGSARGLQVEGHGALAALAGGEHGLHVAVDVAGGGLDLEDVGAEFGQHQGGDRAGEVGGQVEDADALE